MLPVHEREKTENTLMPHSMECILHTVEGMSLCCVGVAAVHGLHHADIQHYPFT
jgi:hypothetical protein